MEEVESCTYHRTSIYRQQSSPLELRQRIQGRNKLERVPSPLGQRSKTCWRSDGQGQLDGRENPMSCCRLELVHREPPLRCWWSLLEVSGGGRRWGDGLSGLLIFTENLPSADMQVEWTRKPSHCGGGGGA